MRVKLLTCVNAVALTFATFAGAPAASAQVVEPSGTFSALTYNVAGLPEGLSGSNPSVNTPLISPLLNDYDLVLVQEDWADPEPPLPGVDFFHDDLISEVTHPYLSTPATAPQGQDPRRPSALVADGLNRLSRFPFGDVTRVMWPNCFGGADTSDGGAGDCLSQKGFSVARTDFAPDISVDVYNLHAEAGGTALDEQYSAEDFAVLAEYVTQHSAGRAVIVGGDFNLHTDRPVDRGVFDTFLAATGLVDVCVAVDCGADADEIDKFVFRSGGGVTLEVLTHHFERETFVRDDGERLSDHDALAVSFRWTRQAPGSITGTVVDDEDQPVAGAIVSAFGAADTWVGSAEALTGADGTYEIGGVVPGEYRVRLHAPTATGFVGEWFDNAPQRRSSTPVTVPIGGEVSAVDAQFAIGGSVGGSVVDAAGTPVTGVTVWAYGPADLWVGLAGAVTDGDGTYTIAGIEPGVYRIYFRPPSASGLRPEWFDDASRRNAAQVLTVEASASLTDVNAQLSARSS